MRVIIPRDRGLFLARRSSSAPPLRLCGSGLGELDTAVVVTGLVPWLGFALQASPDLAGAGVLLAAIVPAMLLQLAMLLAIEFPDAAAGKRTLVVRLGAARAARLYAAITLAAYAWLPFAYWLGVPGLAVALAAAPVPIAIWQLVAGVRDPAGWERSTFLAVAPVVAAAATMLAGVVLA